MFALSFKIDYNLDVPFNTRIMDDLIDTKLEKIIIILQPTSSKNKSFQNIIGNIYKS